MLDENITALSSPIHEVTAVATAVRYRNLPAQINSPGAVPAGTPSPRGPRPDGCGAPGFRSTPDSPVRVLVRRAEAGYSAGRKLSTRGRYRATVGSPFDRPQRQPSGEEFPILAGRARRPEDCKINVDVKNRPFADLDRAAAFALWRDSFP